MNRADDDPRETSAKLQPEGAGQPSPGGGPTQDLVDTLARAFVEQLGHALPLPNKLSELGPTALAFVDHYLSLVRDETREPIVTLVAAGAGAWFGELVRAEVGGTWIGDGSDPRRLRLLLEPQFLHFAPVDLAYEAIFSGEVDPDDPRVPEGPPLDSEYHLHKQPRDTGEPSDHDWVAERLAEAAPVPEDQFYSLTGRFETLLMMLELLAGRDLAGGREPTHYHLNDYIAALA